MSDEDLIRSYFDAFNEGEAEVMLSLLSEDVEHHVNQGEVRRGKHAFRAFLAEMDRAYSEQAESLVVMTGPEGRAAAEFTIRGTYEETQEGLPEARGQDYALPVGSFFAIEGGKIARVTTYYNLQDWLEQVRA